jgi:CDP-4-dehydro-6-deoxyglucose reductase
MGADESVLMAGVRQGINLPYGCKDGACGSCKCKLLAGTVRMSAYQPKALTTDEVSSGLILTCCATPQSDLLLESRQVTELGALPIKKMPARVNTLTRKSEDVMVLQLQLPANETFTYRAGQYVEFVLRDGSRRCYSMANASPDGTGIELHIRHMPGGKFTDHVFGGMKDKDILRIEGPFGSFYLREDSAKPIILLASGTGFAPIKAIIEAMQHASSRRSVTLYWGARRPGDLYMNDWVVDQLAGMVNLRYVPVISHGNGEDRWVGRTGNVHLAVLEDCADLCAHQVYACGAPAMVEAARRDFISHGKLPADEFFADSFTSEADRPRN